MLSIPYAGNAAVYFEQPVGVASLVVVAVADDASGERDGVSLAGAEG